MRLHLRILNAPEGNQTITLDPPGGPVGRSAESAVHLPYDSVSRQHAELRYDGQSWWIHHQSQSSLTLLDDQLVAAGAAPGKLLPRGLLKLGRIALQYWQESAPVFAAAPATLVHRDSDATMIMSRHLAPMAIPPAMLAQLSPVRVAESAPSATPATLIRRLPGAVPPPPPPSAMAATSQTPETLIMRPANRAAAPNPGSRAQPLAQPMPMPAIEHTAPSQSPSKPDPQVPFDPQHDRLQSERDRLAAEVARLRHENEGLRDARSALIAQMEALRKAAPLAPLTGSPSADVTSLREKAVELLQPFSRSLEQAGEALRQDDTAQARSLLRSASFGLADLRDLFQP